MLKLFIVVNVDWFFLSHRKEIAINALINGYDVTIVTKDTGRRNEIESLGLRFVNLPMNRVGINIYEEIKTLVFHDGYIQTSHFRQKLKQVTTIGRVI